MRHVSRHSFWSKLSSGGELQRSRAYKQLIPHLLLAFVCLKIDPLFSQSTSPPLETGQAAASKQAEKSQREGTDSAPRNLRAIDRDSTSILTIPRLAKAPTLEDFLDMRAQGPAAQQMVKVSGFIQREPHDDALPSHSTDVYLGYDHKNLYVVFVAYDDPHLVRARPSRRENIFSDDTVGIMLDTFHDRRRAYEFVVNPLGAQWDAIWREQAYDQIDGHLDPSWDAFWYSKGKVTTRGFVVWVAIPFRSLRFPAIPDQTWGLILVRDIARDQEKSFWPRVTANKEGRLGQAATAHGLNSVSPGRNVQLIPYGLLNSFHSLEQEIPTLPTTTIARSAEHSGLTPRWS